MHINTEGGVPVTSKTEYVAATYWLEGDDPVGSEAEPLPLEIRGRGHSSWKGIKKPYKLRLAEKTPLLGMARNKHWALIKPVEGNIAGMELSRILGLEWTPALRPVEVVLNGDYIGLYLLSETIRIGSNRVDIFEQEDLETDPELIAGGWLVEVDNYREPNSITIPENNYWNLTVKPHSPENLSAPQRQWLRAELEKVNGAVYAEDKTSREWERYLDVRSLARFFILQEVMDNPDGFHGSFYLHKDLGDGALWTAGPAWDLSCYNRPKTDYTFRMKVHYIFTPHWIGELIQYDSFCRAVAEIWDEVYPAKLDALYDYVDRTILPLEQAWDNDHERWGDDMTQTAAFRAERIKNALRANIKWFNGHLPVSAYTSAGAPAVTDGPVRAYNLQGIYLGRFRSEAEALKALPSGIYIINNKKTIKP